MSSESRIARISAAWYLAVSGGLALIFFMITTFNNYPAVARYGGAIWVFILTMIITMPIVIPLVKKKYE